MAFVLNLLQPVGFLARIIATAAFQSMQFGQPVELCPAQAQQLSGLRPIAMGVV